MTNGLAESITKFSNQFNKVSWVACPICQEEWTKLRPCLYWSIQDDKPKKQLTYICAECAESLWKFDKIVQKFPQNRFDNWREPVIVKSWQKESPAHAIYHKEFQDETKILLTKNIFVKLWINGKNSPQPQFILSSSGSRILVIEMATEKIRFYDSTIAAWFAIRDESMAPKEDEPWSKQ